MAGMDVTALKRRAGTVWSGFTSGQKTMLALAAAGLILGGYMFTKWASEPQWAALYGNLTATDAASVTSELGSAGVAYKLSDGGATVMVPQADVYQLRLDMSAKGLPTQGSPGYALLDKQGITTSEFRQRVDYQRALEGELARTISAIDGVSGVDVHLVIPAEDLFTDDASHPSASVMLRPTAGRKFTSGQVRAIVHLVSSSVEGLEPEAVAVADSSGKVLSAPGEEDPLAGAEGHAAQAKAYEDGLANSITQLLAPVTGAGGAVVRVNAVLDFDQRQTTTERFENPETAPVLAESSTSETFTGPGGTAGGVLGPDGIPAAVGAGATDYSKEDTERTFAVGKVTEQAKSAPGRVTRLSVAVLLDQKSKADSEEVSTLVAAAAGVDPGRGDVVEVSRMAFDRSAQQETAKEMEAAQAQQSRSQMMNMIQTGVAMLLVLVVLFLAWRSARKAAVTRVPLSTPGALPSGLSAEDLALLNTARAAIAPGSVPPGRSEAEAYGLPAGATAALGSGASHEVDVSDEIGELIDRQPEEVAQILRGWLAEKR
jgi:flagellar M-ring protein FliF